MTTKEAIKDNAYALFTDLIVVGVFTALLGGVGYGIGELTTDGDGGTWAAFTAGLGLLGSSAFMYRVGHEVILVDGRWWDKDFQA